MDARGSVLMRKILFPKGPYVAWYVYDRDAAAGEVWLLRLFHARQHRPSANLGRWLGRGPFGK